MSSFSESFRKNVTIQGALCAMLFSEEKQGDNQLATQLQIAIENMHSDLLTFSEVHSGFDPKSTMDDALNRILNSAYSLLRQDPQILPDEAILQVIENHQKRHFPTIESAQERIQLVREAFSMVGHVLQRWQAA